MAQNPARRQRKLEKQRAKKKAEKRVLARRQSATLGNLVQQSGGRVLHCAMMSSYWTSGLGTVWIGRELHGGQVALAAFLIDRFLLGVKDAFGGAYDRAVYYDRKQRYFGQQEFEDISIEYAAKLVRGAVAYALQWDIQPAPEYRRLSSIFYGIDPDACAEEFTFGKDGKPFFVQGSHDSPERCREILEKISRNRSSVGDANFVMRLDSAEPPLNEFDDDEDDLDSLEADFTDVSDEPENRG